MKAFLLSNTQWWRSWPIRSTVIFDIADKLILHRNILITLFTLFAAWRELHRLEITVDEFLDKAAALKGNIDVTMAQQRDDDENNENNENDEEDELQELPPIRLAGDIWWNVTRTKRAVCDNTFLKSIPDPDFEEGIFAEEPPRFLIDNAGALAENGKWNQWARYRRIFLKIWLASWVFFRFFAVVLYFSTHART